MKCLAANTATSVLSVALVDNGNTLFSHTSPETRDQGNVLIGFVRDGLKKTGLTYADIDLYAAVTGPGSFTGIRIGLAAMRGFALAAEKPVVGISTFDLFTQKAQGKKNIVVVESWRDELYFRIEDEDPVNTTPEDFVKTLGDGPFFISGDAREKLRELLPNSEYAADTPDSVHLARLALLQKPPYTEALPYYLRPADVTLSTRINRKVAD